MSQQIISPPDSSPIRGDLATSLATAPKVRRATPRDYLVALIVAVVIALLVRTCLIHAYRIPSSSMENTLLIGDYILANRLVFGAPIELPFVNKPIAKLPALRKPRRGEIVIFESWDNPDRDFIKRVVAVSGDTVSVVDGIVFIDGKRFTEVVSLQRGSDGGDITTIKRGDYSSWLGQEPFGPHIVGEDAVFVMGDNRQNSQDSRYWGDVPLSRLKGSAVLVYWSWNDKADMWNIPEMVRWNRIGTAIR